MTEPPRVGGLSHVTRAGTPLDLWLYVVVGPIVTYQSGKSYARHTYLLAWGIDGEGRMTRRESWDDAEIKAFIRRLRKTKRVKLQSAWDSRSTKPMPSVLITNVRARQLDFG